MDPDGPDEIQQSTLFFARKSRKCSSRGSDQQVITPRKKILCLGPVQNCHHFHKRTQSMLREGVNGRHMLF